MKILNIVSVIIIFFLSLSCDNNPVLTKREFLPPLYSWSVDTFYVAISDFLIIDTNSYYAVSGYNLIWNSNGIVTNIPIGANCNTLDGNGADNIVLGGSRAYKQTSSVPVLLKYNNGSISDLYTGANPNTGQTFVRVRLIDDVFWCGTNKGEVVTVRENLVNYYLIDSSYYIVDILKDNSSNIYAYAFKELRDTNGSVTNCNYRLYSFAGNNWNVAYNENIKGVFNIYEGIANHIFCLKPVSDINTTYEYDAGIFTKILAESSTGVWTNLARGKSFTDIIICGGTIEEHNVGLYHWDGNSISKEIFDVGLYDPRIMKCKNDRYYALFTIHLIFKSLLFKGKLKY